MSAWNRGLSFEVLKPFDSFKPVLKNTFSRHVSATNRHATQTPIGSIHQHQPHALILFKTGATGTEDVLVGERKLESIASYYPGDAPSEWRFAIPAKMAKGRILAGAVIHPVIPDDA